MHLHLSEQLLIGYIFSHVARALSGSSDMYPVYSHSHHIDLFNLYCWIFFNQWSPMGGITKAMVNIPSNTGLNRKYWDIYGADYDQTHHFAGYFWWGAHFGIEFYSSKGCSLCNRGL